MSAGWNITRSNFYPRPPRGGRPPTPTRASPSTTFLSTPSARRATVDAGKATIMANLFLSTPSARRATEPSTPQSASSDGFLSTPSARRATPANEQDPHRHQISIHALREEGDITSTAGSLTTSDFYPRPPRGGRRLRRNPTMHSSSISIHALREEGDRKILRALPSILPISIHALREEGDSSTTRMVSANPIFLSTPSARRATWDRCRHRPCRHYFYPRPPRGGRHDALLLLQYGVGISIHALREEGDDVTPRVFDVSVLFLSTPSARRATPLDTFSAGKLVFLSTPSARRATMGPSTCWL